MITPQAEAVRFLTACLLGAGLGMVYGFLRPLRPRHTALADWLFLAAAFLAWLQLSFGVCGGDLRLSYTAGLALGALFWEQTGGRLLRPVFRGLWRLIFGIFSLFSRPLKKFFQKTAKFRKILFASCKKWVTIKWNNRRQLRRKKGGANHGRAGETPGEAGFLSEQAADESRHAGGRRTVYGGADLPVDRHRQRSR